MTCAKHPQQDKAILNFDAANLRLYLRDLLCVDPGNGVKGWVLECLLPDGRRRTLTVPKQMGYAPCPPDWRMTLLELDESTAYVRMPNFAPVERAADEKKLSVFLAGGSRWKRLIIDVRENQGGDPTLWVNCIVAPLIRKELAWTQDSLVRKAWADEHSNLYPMDPKGFVELWPKAQGHRVDRRDLPFPGDWEVYRMTRTVSPLRGGLFGLSSKSGFKGKVYLLMGLYRTSSYLPPGCLPRSQGKPYCRTHGSDGSCGSKLRSFAFRSLLPDVPCIGATYPPDILPIPR